jgi:hypothetical protein
VTGVFLSFWGCFPIGYLEIRIGRTVSSVSFVTVFTETASRAFGSHFHSSVYSFRSDAPLTQTILLVAFYFTVRTELPRGKAHSQLKGHA